MGPRHGRRRTVLHPPEPASAAPLSRREARSRALNKREPSANPGLNRRDRHSPVQDTRPRHSGKQPGRQLRMPPGAGRAAAALMLQQPRPPGSLRLGGFAGMLPIPDFELLAPLDRSDIDRLGIMRNTLNERHDSTPCYTRRQNADVPFLFLRAGKARGEVCGSSKTVANAMPPVMPAKAGIHVCCLKR